MYQFTLALHSLFRWLVLVTLVYAVFHCFRAWLCQKSFTRKDDFIRKGVVTVTHIQFTIGVVLYIVSPMARYFLSNFGEAIHMRDIRFFGLEHITMMVIAVGLITTGSGKGKQRQIAKEKFKTLAIWYAIALFIILISIPWPFSPFTARPYLRSW